MRYWVATPAAALGAAIFLIFAAPAPEGVRLADCVKVAALDTSHVASDACIVSTGVQTGTVVCAQSEAVVSSARETALEWPGDFIALTASAALAMWQVAVSVVETIYQFAAAAGDAIT